MGNTRARAAAGRRAAGHAVQREPVNPVGRPGIVGVERFEDQQRGVELTAQDDRMLEREIPARGARRSSSRGRSRRAGSEGAQRVDSRSRDWRAGQRATASTLLRSREDRRIVSERTCRRVSMCPGVVINFAAGHWDGAPSIGWLRSYPGRSSTLYREPVSWPFCSDGTGICQSSTTTGSSQNRRVVALWSRRVVSIAGDSTI